MKNCDIILVLKFSECLFSCYILFLFSNEESDVALCYSCFLLAVVLVLIQLYNSCELDTNNLCY